MDVVGIWKGRHANALQRAFRLTNEGFADRLGVAVRTVAKWNAHPELEQTPEMQQVLDTVLSQAPDDVKARFAQIAGAGTMDPAASTNGRPEVSDDITSLVAEITSSSTNDETISQLERAASALAESHTQVPAKKVLAQAFQLHREVQALLSRTQRLSQRRTLYRIESDLLAHACLLLGDLKRDETANQYGAASRVYAQEAGSNQALAWSALAKTLRWQERLIESAEAARQGYECSPATPIRIQLASQEANAAALLGDFSRAREALRRSEAAAETVAPDSGTSAWSFATGRQALFSLAVATQTGDPEGALRGVEMADAGWAAGEPYVPANWAQIRVGAGIAHLMQGDLDGAIEEVTPMLTLAPERRVATVTSYVDNLDHRLGQSQYRGNKSALELRQQLREFNSAALLEHESTKESR
jgi:tetratricopeptide (TPR) repeat protein